MVRWAFSTYYFDKLQQHNLLIGSASISLNDKRLYLNLSSFIRPLCKNYTLAYPLSTDFTKFAHLAQWDLSTPILSIYERITNSFSVHETFLLISVYEKVPYETLARSSLLRKLLVRLWFCKNYHVSACISKLYFPATWPLEYMVTSNATLVSIDERSYRMFLFGRMIMLTPWSQFRNDASNPVIVYWHVLNVSKYL